MPRAFIADFTAAAIVSLFAIAHAQAQVETVYAFPMPGGTAPRPTLISASDGNLYGTTTASGPNNCGNVFRMTPAGAVTSLHQFNCDEGSLPSVWFEDGNGSLYGTASGGATGAGFVFRIAPAGAFEIVHAFAAASEGSDPSSLLLGSDGFLYGTNVAGGTGAYGTVYRMTSAGATTVLHQFAGGLDGGGPQMLVQVGDGRIYGWSSPTLFDVDPATGGFGIALRFVASVCHDFGCVYPYGQDVQALTNGPDGWLYGTTPGTAFRLSPTYTRLHDFSYTEGTYPQALTQGSDGNLYGATKSLGELGHGELFRMNTAGDITLLHAFDTSDGGPTLGLVQVGDGTLFGTTSGSEDVDGTASPGVIYAQTPAGEFSVRQMFAASTDGAEPNGVIQGADGMLYGTTAAGGVMNHGTVFRLTGDGHTEILHEFQTLQSTEPTLMQAADGHFFGTTYRERLPTGQGDYYAECGSVFRLTSSGIFTALYRPISTIADACRPLAPLIQAHDGLLYGTSLLGGFSPVTVGGALLPVAGGAVFRMAADGACCPALLHGFQTAADGLHPAAALVQADDHTFYGTTAAGGNNDMGTVFHMTSDGTTTTLHRFAGTDGAVPVGQLVQASDGNLYGATFAGGTSNLGTVFKMSPGGSPTVVHEFSGGDGAAPTAGLIQADDGNLYGATAGGGASGLGTIFKMTLDGSFTSLHSFNGADGARPTSPLIQASDGDFYGTTRLGGSSNSGVIYRLVNFRCEDALTLDYTDGTLALGFQLMASKPASWSTWLFVQNQLLPLWSVDVPTISPAVSFDVPIPGFPRIGDVGVLTVLTKPGSPFVCWDWKTVDTNAP